MTQQNNSEINEKYCFGPRDLARQNARRAIRQRVDRGLTAATASAEDANRCAWNHHPDVVVDLLHRIISNDRSFFSLQNLDKRRGLLSSPIPIKLVWQDDCCSHEELRGQDKLTSWYGFDGVKLWKEFFNDLKSLMPLDYAIIFQRYHIVGSFVLGGINPCMRGHFCQDTDMNEEWEEEIQSVGSTVLQKFFDGVPLALSSYAMKQSFDLRFAYWESNQDNHTCNLCARTHIPQSFRVSFSCLDVFCEPCYWIVTMERLDKSDADVVACPCCHPLAGVSSLRPMPEPKMRLCRKQESLSKFLDLPKDGNDLKQLKRARKAKNGRFILCSTWSDAVKPLLGATQETRSDRFFKFVETGSLRRVHGCLDLGVDLDFKNQYGITALLAAAWRGHGNIVRMLLNYGADPQLAANGGATPSDAAASKGFTDIVHLLQEYGGYHFDRRDHCLPLLEQRLVAVERISQSAQHPGAGSYTIDGILSEETIQRLVSLWKSLPVAEGKKKAGSCSERRYYCNIEEHVTSILYAAVTSVSSGSEDVIFLPFMRFLCYNETGAVLAPHVDLCREDYDSGKKSTHTFILYLTDCVEGGATSLLASLSGDGRHQKLAVVRPVRGRLLLFPHACPHEGEEVIDLPKLLIRGEAFLPEGFYLQRK